MRLPPSDVSRFYNIWKPLLLFVNRRLRLVPHMLDRKADERGSWDIADVQKMRDALWAEDELRQEFTDQNPAGLAPADLDIVRSWEHRVAGDFYILRQLKKHALVVAEAEEGPTIYGVLGLSSSLDEVVPFLPCYTGAVLLPWEGQIIYDSLLTPYNIVFGGGIRRSLNDAYRDAKERGAIVTSLLPSEEPAGAEQRRADARATSARVLDAFRKHLFASGLSPRVVDRNLAHVADFAMNYLATLPEPLSLRDFGPDETSEYLSRSRPGPALTTATRASILTGMKRLVRFLRDTERMDYWHAEDIREMLSKGSKGTSSAAGSASEDGDE